jgi:hypothetical protein
MPNTVILQMIRILYLHLMKWSKLWLLMLVSCWIYPSILTAQHYYIPLQRDITKRYDEAVYGYHPSFHTSVKPYISNEIEEFANPDSVMYFARNKELWSDKWIGRKIWREHLLDHREDDYHIWASPYIEFTGGRSSDDFGDETITINSRGFVAGGEFGKRFSFRTSFLESAADYPSYIDSAIQKTFVVPGGARTKNLNGKYDYGTVNGTISYRLKKYFSFQFGHDKNFIGDGYRSMLLSDNAYNYPFFKINASFWKIKYMVLYAFLQDGPYQTVDDAVFDRKYATYHYLDINIGKRLSLGLMEAIIWDDSARGYDINYLNPIIFLRPVEFSIGSPDNALIGINLKFMTTENSYVYGQLMLDEFKIEEIRAGDGWWGNKQGFQLGARAFNFLGVKHLDIFGEYNYARPYLYQHRTTRTAYAHFNQALAHPLGANFKEAIVGLSWSYHGINAEVMANFTNIGYDLDSVGNPVNFGNNVLLSYDTRPDDYGNETGQGVNTDMIHLVFRSWYVINPAYNLALQGGVRLRNTKNKFGSSNTTYFFLGITTSLTNTYLDF